MNSENGERKMDFFLERGETQESFWFIQKKHAEPTFQMIQLALAAREVVIQSEATENKLLMGYGRQPYIIFRWDGK